MCIQKRIGAKLKYTREFDHTSEHAGLELQVKKETPFISMMRSQLHKWFHDQEIG